MQYSCARFAHPGEDLDTAQRRKLDLLCRQLELRPGERLLDIGCGWGGLVLHAAANYGVEAVGYTLSRAQYELANRRIKEAGLADRCRVELCDYRSADFGTFDKIASIEMTAHVAKPQLAAYYAAAWRALRPGGKFLNVWDVRSAAHPARKRQTFVSSYFFPDAQLVSLDELLEAGEQAGFRIGEVENLRDQYVLTYGAWLERMAARRDELVALVGEPAYRTWVLGFAGCSYQTAIGRVGTYQAMLTRPDPANLTGIDLPLG